MQNQETTSDPGVRTFVRSKWYFDYIVLICVKLVRVVDVAVRLLPASYKLPLPFCMHISESVSGVVLTVLK